MPMALLHVISIVMTLVIFQASDLKTWLALVNRLGFAHYLLALVYAKRQFLEVAHQANLFVPLCSVLVLGVGLYVSNVSLLFYFVLHHAFNEIYVLNQTTPVQNEAVRKLRGSAVLLHVLLYLFLLRHVIVPDVGELNPAHLALLQRLGRRGWMNPQLLFAGLAVAYVAFFYYLYRIRSFVDVRIRLDNCAVELFGLVAVVVSFYVQFAFLHLVFYHFAFWALFPAAKMYTQAPRRLLAYIGLTTVSLAGFLLLSPIGMFSSQLHPTTFQKYFVFFSYLHITASFVLSNAHPQWIVDLFRPRLGGEAAIRHS